MTCLGRLTAGHDVEAFTSAAELWKRSAMTRQGGERPSFGLRKKMQWKGMWDGSCLANRGEERLPILKW